jgi:hypothetical protein
MKYIVLALTLLSLSCASKPTANGTAANAKSGKPSDSKMTPATKILSAKGGDKVVEKAKAAATEATCKNGSVIRTLKVVKNGDQCSVEYTKDGATQEIATGAAGSAHCSDVATRVKNNLVAAGYKCE